ncbi:hypothetical protein SARC_00250 [Sphaeroforma arctica JP610]|uniref:TRAPPC10/Trs130 C-terminal domain-containing protein n=1 Tax=Sphaeroforma arctica JP610 TaxID=667725 RepID=A0A0L0GFJ7_9EUKA|nr:hypothetical protein SARC_00250 [Sphaeroforma arctica JP610]KNC87619.1 hypothetical protein SARC_00250 [Sphaeroforma arctica JP610]|eukprot:XP_014161521.1 hypothetical protein SARC_00250 [Sphaeroforma arctica JP610]
MKVEFELADDEYRVTAARTLQHVFEMNIDIYKPEYKSTILFKGMGEYDDVENEITIGESSEAEVLVTYLGDSDEERTVVANVEVNHRHWIVSGHDQRRLALSKNERQGRFGIVLIPLSVGQIFVPRVAMYESVTEGNSLVPCQGVYVLCYVEVCMCWK